MRHTSSIAVACLALASAAMSQNKWLSDSVQYSSGKPYPVTNKRGCAARQKRQSARRKAKK